MIQTKKLLPEVYSESFDMSIFTGLLDLVYTARELNATRAKALHNPVTCFEEELPRLATLFDLTPTATRGLLSNYRLMVKHKGSKLAIKALVAFSALLDPQKELVKIVTSYENNFSLITAYLDFTILDAQLAERLIYKLAPVGAFVQIKSLAEKT